MIAIALALLGLLAVPAWGHELRPAFLSLHEGTPGDFSVLWKTPMQGDLRLALGVELSGRTERMTPAVSRETGAAAVQTWRLRAVDPLRGQSVRVTGLEGTMTDALVQIEFADGTTWTKRLTAREPAAMVPRRQSGSSVAIEYATLGVDHILGGVDHLLFVLALLLVTHGTTRLVKTITAFTVAHSITLALATLGLVRVPPKPVEAVIALSIVFVAAEIVRMRRGRDGVTARAPWVVALAFGLLHGLGFAGALAEVGLPQGHIPLALLCFNVGVEVGQLLYVALVLALASVVRRLVSMPRWADLVPAYAIGGIAMFWVIQRVAAF